MNGLAGPLHGLANQVGVRPACLSVHLCASVYPYPSVCPLAAILTPPCPQEVLLWLTDLQKELGQDVSDEKLRDFIWNTLNSGRVSAGLRGGRGGPGAVGC